jgi:hypothetical protein
MSASDWSFGHQREMSVMATHFTVHDGHCPRKSRLAIIASIVPMLALLPAITAARQM